MIIVTGSGRSGTSMWMQALVAAGLPFVGEAFPGQFARMFGANPRGFYESALRDLGLPNASEELVRQYAGHAIKMFIPAVRRTNAAHIERVICAVRRFDEFAGSMKRMRAMSGSPVGDADALPGIWWRSNYGAVIDAWKRGYPFRAITYDAVTADPEKTVGETMAWLGLSAGDAAKALQAIAPELRTQKRHHGPVIGEESEAFEALYDAVGKGKPLTPALLKKLGDANRRIVDREVERKAQRVSARKAAKANG